MCKKSPSINYFLRKMNTTKKSELVEQLQESPLSAQEFNFILCIMDKMSIAELSDKFHKSPSRISQWKREVCEKIHAFDMATFKR